MLVRGYPPSPELRSRYTRPLAAVTVPEKPAEPTETVSLRARAAAPPDLVARALHGAGQACVSFVFGPLAHLVGRVLGALGVTPAPFDPPVPESRLGSLPPSRISRPLLFVHGWHAELKSFAPLLEKLVENGSNGERVGFVQGGQLFEDPACSHPLERPGADMRVFVSVFSSYRLAPDEAGPELKQNIDCIRRLTGQSRVDVAAHSMGGLCTRLHVDQEVDHGVGRLLMMATPNQGSALADVTRWAMAGEERGYDLRWLLDVMDVQAEDRPALEWLRTRSELRENLNRRWEQQKSRLEGVLHLGTDQWNTPGPRLWPERGDKLVPTRSLELDGLPVKRLGRQGGYGRHNCLLAHPQTYLSMRDFFGWGDA